MKSSTASSPRCSPFSTPGAPDLHRIIADGDSAVAEWTGHPRARTGTPYDNDYARNQGRSAPRGYPFSLT